MTPEEKAIAYDLDQLGIEARTLEAAELVDARATIARLKHLVSRFLGTEDAIKPTSSATQYKDVAQGVWFAFKVCTAGGRVWLRTDTGFVGLDGRAGDHTAARGYDTVRCLTPLEVAVSLANNLVVLD